MQILNEQEKRDSLRQLLMDLSKSQDVLKDRKDRREYESCKKIDTDLFTMTLGSYRMTLHVKGERHDHAVTKVLQKTVDGAASNVSCKDFEGVDLWHICPERVEKKMHEYLCHKVFLDEKKQM